MNKCFILILGLCGFVSLQAQIPIANLVAYYPFCGNANDLSGNGLNGTVNGAVLSADRFGNPNSAYNFNGLNNYINLPPANFVGLNVYSYSVWMKPTANASPYIAYSVGAANSPWCLSVNYNSPSVFAGSYNVGSNPVQSYVTSPANANFLNNWIHVVVTRNLNTLSMYVNSVLIAQQGTAFTNGQAAEYGSSPFRAAIGARSNLQNFFLGDIDDVRIYSSVLTQNDVNALYNEPAFSIAVNSGTICSGNSFVLAPTGAVSYTYSGGTPSVAPVSTTIYTVQGSNNAGCLATTMATVTVESLAISVSSGTICRGNSFILTPSGAASYTFSGGAAIVTPLSTTIYTITSVSNAGCLASATATVQVVACTGIKQLQNAHSDFIIFPNPSKGNFTLHLSQEMSVNGSIVIRDLLGKVFRIEPLNDNEDLKIEINLGEGCYVGELIADGEVVSRKKIIVLQ